MTEIPDPLAKQLADLDGSILTSLQHDLEHKRVALTFEHWDGRRIDVACAVTIYCNVSADRTEGNSEVIRATIRRIENNLLSDLDKIGYLWKLTPEVADDFAGPWINLSIHGETCVEIICRDVQFQ